MPWTQGRLVHIKLMNYFTEIEGYTDTIVVTAANVRIPVLRSTFHIYTLIH